MLYTVVVKVTSEQGMFNNVILKIIMKIFLFIFIVDQSLTGHTHYILRDVFDNCPFNSRIEMSRQTS